MTQIKLPTKEWLRVLDGLSALESRPVVVTGPNGRPAMGREAYVFGEKFIWNAAKDIRILEELRAVHNAVLSKYTRDLMLFKSGLPTAKSPEEEERQKEEIRNKTKEANDAMDKIDAEEQAPEGLLLLPAAQLNLKVTRVNPVDLAKIMVLIDGEPDFGEKAPST